MHRYENTPKAGGEGGLFVQSDHKHAQVCSRQLAPHRETTPCSTGHSAIQDRSPAHTDRNPTYCISVKESRSPKVGVLFIQKRVLPIQGWVLFIQEKIPAHPRLSPVHPRKESSHPRLESCSSKNSVLFIQEQCPAHPRQMPCSLRSGVLIIPNMIPAHL